MDGINASLTRAGGEVVRAKAAVYSKVLSSWRIGRRTGVVLWAGKRQHGKGLAEDRKGLWVI